MVNDPSGRLTFADDSLKITSHATASATLRQNDIILRRAAYVVIVDMVREAGSITINVGSGGNTSINTSGKTVLSCKSVSGNDFVVTIPRTFSGRINSIEVKGIVVIDYNFLNLPEYVSKGPQQQLGYIYDATGRKISQELYNEAGQVVKKSDYAGEFFYENDTLRFISHEEGRAVMKDGVPEYQYHLKDHLGNVRLTFTTEPETETFTATLEEGTQAEEAGNFNNYNPTDWDLFDHTDSGSVYTYSQLLHGGSNSQVGLAKSFSVMPGDTLRAEVYAKYYNVSDDAGNLLGFAAALTSAFGLTGSMTGDPGTAFDVLDSYGSLIANGVVDHSVDPSAPKAYLNILLFDRDHNLVDAAYDQIHVSKMQGANPSVKNDHDHLNEEVVVSEPGYAYIFLSNENPTQVDVYFDDLKVVHVKSPVVQMDDYYPFGATFNSFSTENGISNKKLYQSKEWQGELNLNLYDFEWRHFDPYLARTTTEDPHANRYSGFSPYSWAANNPISVIDPDGRDIIYGTDRVTFTGADAQAAFAALNRSSNNDDNGPCKGPDCDGKKDSKEALVGTPLLAGKQVAKKVVTSGGGGWLGLLAKTLGLTIGLLLDGPEAGRGSAMTNRLTKEQEERYAISKRQHDSKGSSISLK